MTSRQREGTENLKKKH